MTLLAFLIALIFFHHFAYGLSAMPGIKAYRARVADLPTSAPEFQAAGGKG